MIKRKDIAKINGYLRTLRSVRSAGILTAITQAGVSQRPISRVNAPSTNNSKNNVARWA